MDSSFTFVTALTPAAGKIRNAKNSKFNGIVKDTSKQLNSLKQHEETFKPGAFRSFKGKKVSLERSDSSSKITEDSLPSIKSCSDSLYLSSDRSFSDVSFDNRNQKWKNSTTDSDDSCKENRNRISKIVEKVHTGLERITFRKKRNNDKPNTSNCPVQVNNATETDECGFEKIRNLDLDMNKLSIKKEKSPSTSRISGNKTFSKNLFNETPRVGSVNSLLDDRINAAKVWSSNSDNLDVTAKNVAVTKRIMRISDCSAINSEDISPILRQSIAPLKEASSFNIINELTPNKKSIENPEVNESVLPLYDEVQENSLKPDVELKEKKVKGSRKKIEKKAKADEAENVPKTKASEKPVAPKPKRGKKKKDSFIVSDTSSIDNDSMIIYHKVIAKHIKKDIKKTHTPRSKIKHNDGSDDGIFTPFVNRGKRSSSNDSSSEAEMETKRRIKTKKTRLSTSEDSSDSDDLVVSKKYTLFSSSSSESEKEPSVKSRISGNEIKENKLILSSEESDNKNKEFSPTIRRKKIVSGTKNLKNVTPANEKKGRTTSSAAESSTDNEKTSKNYSPNFTPINKAKDKKLSTPITFKLKNINKFTPPPIKVDDKENPSLFLRSLSTAASPGSILKDTLPYRQKFKKFKEELAKKLFTLFNKEIFDNRLPEDMKIEWNGRMRSSAGLCFNRRIKTIIGPNNECLRVSRIALSTKIIETPERLRDTLVHEMCHAAAWIIDNKADGHGPCWKSWANKAMRTFPDIPPIKRCHDYAVQTKFKYKCVNCGYTIGRHSKSLNLERKRCGYCYGRFELLLNNENTKSGVTNTSPRNVKVRPLSKFALFVKENYAKVKSENSSLKHAEIMKVLSKNFAETKNLT